MMSVKETMSLVLYLVQLSRVYFLDKKAEKLAVILTYQTCHPSRERRKPMENLNDFAKQWKDVLVKLSLCHTREGIDQADYKMDDLFTGLFAMPVKQVREFCQF